MEHASIRLMKALGWAGGTIHQVQQETGLSTTQIMAMDETPAEMSAVQDEIFSAFEVGVMFGCTPYNKLKYKGNLQYWKGVLEFVQVPVV